MNIDAYFDKLEQERNGKSFAFLAERVERSAENPYSIAVAKPITADVLPVSSIAFVAPVKPPNREPPAAPAPANFTASSAAAVTILATGSGKPTFFKITTVTITPEPIATFVSNEVISTSSPNNCAV